MRIKSIVKERRNHCSCREDKIDVTTVKITESRQERDMKTKGKTLLAERNLR